MSTSSASAESRATPERHDFIRDIVAADLREGRISEVVTRFPPEPNGYLHIGHPKSIALNFGIAQEFGGRCHLRFDDTNPAKEEQEYIDAIQEDIRWLGFDWGQHLYYASDYFGQLYEWAVDLIEAGKAYVDDLSAEEIREHRGTLIEPGTNSPWRDRSVEENLDLFARMRAGEFPDGARVLRAKIDMASPNLNLRDPVLYRILHATHPRTGDEWCIYPLYDFAHGQSDAIEGITHSVCTLEFADHRPLYDWLIDNLPVPSHPHQYEFARLNLTYTVLSKRFLGRLVNEGVVRGWDDPRMPTVSALRRRGFPPQGLRNFLDAVGVGGKGQSAVEIEMLEHEVRDVLNREAARRFAVVRPLKLVIENYPEGQVEEMEAVNNPEDPAAGTRTVPFGRELWIEQDDFMEEPPSKFFRLAPGREVRLRYAYFGTCTGVVKNDAGEIVELRCTYDPETRGGDAPDGRRPKATLHWLAADAAVPAEVRLYDRLFTRADPGADGDPFADINAASETVLEGCVVEPSLSDLPVGETVQFERLGYFCADLDSRPGHLVFNRTLGLKDSWAKVQVKG
jgi:glutaminyl-tRNA synthetase